MSVESIYQFLANLGYTHPLHPPLTHLTIGLVMGALIFQLTARVSGNDRFAQTAGHCGFLAFLAIFPTAILGLMDWHHFYGAGWIFPVKMKIILAGILVLLLFASIILSFRDPAAKGRVLPVYLLCFFAAAGLGYFGGEIVYGQRLLNSDNRQAAGEKPTAPGFAAVQTILRNNCTNCHTSGNPPKGLILGSYENIMQGTEHHAVVVAGKPDESELIRRVKGLSGLRMPPSGPALPDSDIQTLEKWIAAGAPGPENE